MKKGIWAAMVILGMGACKDGADKQEKSGGNREAPTTVEAAATDSEWTAIFDGATLKGWHEFQRDGVSDNWKVEDGALVFYPPEKREKGVGYNLISDKEYTNFELSIDWRISENGNSGIFWGINESPEIERPYHSGPEIQVLDNQGHPDAKNGTNHQAGALYDMVSPSTDATKPVGEWNTTVITVNHKTNQGSVVLNGKQVVSFPVNGPKWDAMVADSKFAQWEHFGKYPTGRLGLQDHGDVVAFKNIKIKEL